MAAGRRTALGNTRYAPWWGPAAAPVVLHEGAEMISPGQGLLRGAFDTNHLPFRAGFETLREMIYRPASPRRSRAESLSAKC